MKIDRVFANSCFIVGFMIGTRCLSAADPITPEMLAQSARRHEQSKAEVERSPDFLSRVRKTTWQLLAGEMAGDPIFGLSSHSYDELTQGLKDLDQLAAELNEIPNRERELTQNLQLAMRFDATRSRRSTLERRLTISRGEELERLSQLREINRTYRELIGQLLRMHTSLVIGQTEQVARFGTTASQLMTDVEQIVARRRDYYLFQDEPALGTQPDEELKLVTRVVQPLAQDVRRHQLALQAYSLVQLARSAPENTRDQLMAAKELAETAIADSSEPPVLGNWALALACREIARLQTIANPWDDKAHQRARVWFDLAQKHLAATRQGIVANPELARWSAETQDQASELASPDFEMEKATKLLESGQVRQAVAILEHCATMHRSRQVALALADCRRFAGDPLDELDEFIHRIWESGLLTDQDPSSRLVRGRQGVVGIWKNMVIGQNERPVANWKQKFDQRLSKALTDLNVASESDDNVVRQLANSYLALGSVIQFTMEPTAVSEIAKSQLLAAPALIGELKEQLLDAKNLSRLNFAEAIIAGQIAYGYLALRLLPDYRDVGPKSFASATDLRTTLPASLTLPQPLGSVFLTSLISREVASDARLAQEEQFVRKSLQRAFPSIAAMQFAPDATCASNLRATARGLEGFGDQLHARLDVDPLEPLDARANAGHQIRTATILAFLSSHNPAEALRESLVAIQPEMETAELTNLNLNDIRDRLRAEADPVRKSVTAMAIEEYAVSSAISSSEATRSMLSLALELQQSARVQFNESAILKATRPSEIEMNRQAIRRLADPAYYEEQSRELLKEFRLSEARKLLDGAIRRHPEAVKLREAFVQTLIDEADLRPEVSKELIGNAIRQLEAMIANSDQNVFESLLKLAGLYERTASNDKARAIYRQVVDQTGNERQRLLARSRLMTLQVRTEKR